MSSTLSKLLVVSRPHLWVATAGCYYVGVSLASGDVSAPLGAPHFPILLLLTFPANLFLYALNDAFDVEADKGNPRKQSFERGGSLLTRRDLLRAAAGGLLPVLFLFAALPPLPQALAFLWLAIVVTYNVPPLRFKARPPLDLLFAFGFPLWALIGYAYATGTLMSWPAVVLLGIFAALAHLYTASLDIEYDRAAGIRTVATFVGSFRRCALVCAAAFVAGTVALYGAGHIALSIVASMYGGFFLFLLWRDPHARTSWYKAFLALHYAAGFFILW